MSAPVVLVVCTANLDKNRGGDSRQLRHLRDRLTVLGRRFAAPTALALQEYGHGAPSVVVELSRTGTGSASRPAAGTLYTVDARVVHNGIRVVRVKVEGGSIAVASLHGPHWRTAGPLAGRRYWREALTILRKLDGAGPLVVCFDANRRGEWLAKKLGGRFVGDGIVGMSLSPELVPAFEAVDAFGLEHHLTDHPAIICGIAWAPRGGRP